MERKNTFNEVAKEYDRYRPDYPDELFADIAEYAGLRPDSDLLEIGCGTGQATKGFVQRGFDRLTCIELGEQLAALTREKFKERPNVQVIHSSFEAWSSDKRFDAAVSGTAFHFIEPQSSGYRKVHELLREGGSIALFWTVHVASGDPVFQHIRDCYKRHAPQLDDSRKPTVEQVIEDRTRLTLADGLFEDLSVRQYRWNDAYSADEYAALLNTNSRHRLLLDAAKASLLGEIRRTIEDHGGSVIKPQAAVLFLARKKPLAANR
ncbi:class I SAM-dependent methyltransferase [Paenibacillus ginsengihumi]|uniref:class I SAM-dependent methyltransferase n=1 Tax=Paenibacillus ginsengihumi TaxID=431596 RepID=UPI0003727DE7|nr:class I SAM-dependent methyltransferase [Paenibacillus ginsengihumi]